MEGLTRPRSSAAAVVTSLKVEPGRLRGREGDARRGPGSRRCAGRAQRRRRACPRAQRRRPPGARCGWSCGSPSRGAAVARASDPVARHELAAGTPAQPLLEGLLETALAHGPVGRVAARVQRPALLGASPAAPCARRSNRRFPRAARCARRPGPSARTLPSCERRVARTAGALTPSEALARAQLREHEPGRPVHAIARHRDAQVAAEAAEDARLDHHGHGHLAPVDPLRVARLELGHRGGGGRAPVRAPEALDREARARLLAQQVMHRAQVAALPGVGEVAGHALRGRRACSIRRSHRPRATRPRARQAQGERGG